MILNGSITLSQQIIPVLNLTLFNAEPYTTFDILVDSELMTVISVVGSSFYVLRGVKGSKATSHDDQAIVYDPNVYRQHNEPLGLRDSLGHKVLIGSNLTIDSTNTLVAFGGGGGGGDLSSLGSYFNPSWLTSVLGGIVSGDIPGNAASINGSITESQVTNLISELGAKELLANKNQSLGYCGLDSSGLISTNQLPPSLTGALHYQGLWNANTNSPTLVSSTGTAGYFYKVSVAGSTILDDVSSWSVGDQAIFDGTSWGNIPNYEAVTSVNGQTGIVNLASTNLTDTASIVLTSGSYANPSWLTSLDASKLTGNIVATDAVLTTNTYSNPSWLTSILGSIVSGDISGNAASINNSITESQVTNLVTDLSLKEVTANKNANNGYCGLDSGAKIATAQLPAAIIGSVNYKGVWNATTNTPTLVSSVGTKGDYYKVSVAGTTSLNGINTWQPGDWAIYNGSAWDIIVNYEAITSVNGQTGAVSLSSTNLTNSSVILLSTGSYANPSWITSLNASKLTGTIVATNGVVTTGSYNNPSWIVSLNANKIIGNITITNGVVTTGSYANPSWITSLAGSKITGNIPGNAASITGTITQSQVVNLVTNLVAKAPLAPALNVDTDASTVTFDLSVSLLHQVTLGGNRTLAISNATVGNRFIIILKQDGTGNRKVTWFSTIIWSGFVPLLNPTPNKYDTFEFICIGTNSYLGSVLQSEVYNRPCLLG